MAGSDFALAGCLDQVVSRTERECHDGHRWLTAAGTYQTTTVDHEEIGDIMRAIVFVDY
jgi:hypothetical protein